MNSLQSEHVTNVFKMSTVSVHTCLQLSTLLITMLFSYAEKCVNVDVRVSNIDISK